jgi:hypothetical protein
MLDTVTEIEHYSYMGKQWKGIIQKGAVLAAFFLFAAGFGLVHAQLTTNLAALYRFDQNATDASGNGNHGTISGATFVTGRINQALSFDGVNDYVNVGDPANGTLDLGTGSFTIASWVRTPSSWWTGDAYRAIVAKATSFSYSPTSTATNGWGFLLGNNRRLSLGLPGVSIVPILSDTATLNTNTWYHMAVTYNASNNQVTYYINGIRLGTVKTSAEPVNLNNSRSFRIGTESDGGRPLLARLDELAVWKRALTPTEITGLYTAGTVGAPSAPYPKSQIIQSITWDWSTHTTAAPGSDLWPVTWADDDHLYTAWGDGGGFGGTGSDGRVALGFARIEGGPVGYTGVNVNGGKNPLFPASFPSIGKSSGITSVDGTLYAWLNTQDSSTPSHKLIWSTNHGATWNQSPWSFDSNVFAPSGFVQFGRDYTGARDGYVYFYGGRWGQATKNIYLVRVLRSQITDNTRYEYFTGLSAGSPTWSTNQAARQPVYTDANSVEFNDGKKIQAVYNPGIGRYIITTWHKGPGGLGVFEGPEPWGPWSTIYYADNFGNMGAGGEGLTSSFPQKWMSPDGLTMWNVFSVYGTGAQTGVNGHDRFNLVRTRLTLLN